MGKGDSWIIDSSENPKYAIKKLDLTAFKSNYSHIAKKVIGNYFDNLSDNNKKELWKQEYKDGYNIYFEQLKNQIKNIFEENITNKFGIKFTKPDNDNPEWKVEVINLDELSVHNIETRKQIIYFGAPGTGKSFKVKEKIEKNDFIRVTFHPDMDYNYFIGCYKPITIKNESNEKDSEISYEFIPGPFINAYCNAWEKYLNNKENEPKQYLVIEEINRGNCSAIFGDIFQLLDRQSNGFSEYTIDASEELKQYLKNKFDEKKLKKIQNKINDATKSNTNNNFEQLKLCLPPNLFIYATMNTSDQSLFPMDSAFKRRWDWKYVPIDTENTDAKNYIIKIGEEKYKWLTFLKEINEKIHAITESEDKKLGQFFIKPDKKDEPEKKDKKDTIISEDSFISKVMFYLWNDILKEESQKAKDYFFKKEDKEPFTFNDIFKEAVKTTLLKYWFEYLGLEPETNP